MRHSPAEIWTCETPTSKKKKKSQAQHINERSTVSIPCWGEHEKKNKCESDSHNLKGRLLVLFVTEADVIKQRVGVTVSLSLLLPDEKFRGYPSLFLSLGGVHSCHQDWQFYRCGRMVSSDSAGLEQGPTEGSDKVQMENSPKRRHRSSNGALLLIGDWNVKTQHRREMTRRRPKACSQASKKNKDERLQGFSGRRPPKHSRSSAAWTASGLISPTLCETSAPPPGTASSTYSPGEHLRSQISVAKHFLTIALEKTTVFTFSQKSHYYSPIKPTEKSSFVLWLILWLVQLIIQFQIFFYLLVLAEL